MRVHSIAPAVAMLVLACEFGSSTGGTPGGDSGTEGSASTGAHDSVTDDPGPGDGADGADDGPADDGADDEGTGGGEAGSTSGCVDEGECAPGLRPLHYENPCTGSMTRACPWSTFCVMADEATDTAIFEGDEGVVYDVTLRFRGVVSQVFIAGGETDGHFNEGGEPMPVNPFHPVRLDVSDPRGTYYLNAGPDQAEYCVPIDYEHTVPIAAGAEVTLGHYDTSSCSPLNIDPDGTPVSLDGIEDPAQPYDGQFFRADFVAAQPLP